MRDGWSVVVGAAFSLFWLGFTAVQVARLPRVWRGERVGALPWPNPRGPEINYRSFPVFVGFSVLVVTGWLLLFLSWLADMQALGVIGVVCAIAGVFVLFPLWVVVNAINRPRFLVPPSHRRHGGWWDERRSRRKR